MKEDLAQKTNKKLFLVGSLHEAKGDCGTGWHYLKYFFVYTEDQLINVDKLNETIFKINCMW